MDFQLHDCNLRYFNTDIFELVIALLDLRVACMLRVTAKANQRKRKHSAIAYTSSGADSSSLPLDFFPRIALPPIALSLIFLTETMSATVARAAR
jgi:hypothetical protein